MKECIIVICSFFGGAFAMSFIYRLLCVLFCEEDKLIVYKSSKKSKRERIEKLEYEVDNLKFKLREIDYCYNRMFERNKSK